MTVRTSGPLQTLILAGGRSRRLGGVPKAGLIFEGQTLLARTVDAAARALDAHAHPDTRAFGAQLAPAGGGGTAQAGIAVVGPGEEIGHWLEGAEHGDCVAVVQEEPPYSGPAAGIAAGLDALAGEEGHVLVLACDMPRAGDVARRLLEELGHCVQGQGVMAVAGDRRQPLAAVYPLRALRAAAEAARAAHRLENASVFAMVASVNMEECVVPSALTADIDTWADARAQGIAAAPADAEG